jgi:RES domain-containing protein
MLTAEDKEEITRYRNWLGERRLRSAVLAVPSAIVAQEQNYLLNPRHPDFLNLNIRFSAPEHLNLNRRLTRRLQ